MSLDIITMFSETFSMILETYTMYKGMLAYLGGLSACYRRLLPCIGPHVAMCLVYWASRETFNVGLKIFTIHILEIINNVLWPVNMHWEHVNMSWELVTMSSEFPTLSIKPLSISKYTYYVQRYF
jgi:hypothetical protein